MGICLPYKKAT
jgi:hypothetical protein